MHRFVKKFWWSDIGLSVLLGVIFLQIFVMYPLIHAGTGLVLIHILFILVLIRRYGGQRNSSLGTVGPGSGNIQFNL
jgi:hypothetical protein